MQYKKQLKNMEETRKKTTHNSLKASLGATCSLCDYDFLQHISKSCGHVYQQSYYPILGDVKMF